MPITFKHFTTFALNEASQKSTIKRIQDYIYDKTEAAQKVADVRSPFYDQMKTDSRFVDDIDLCIFRRPKAFELMRAFLGKTEDEFVENAKYVIDKINENVPGANVEIIDDEPKVYRSEAVEVSKSFQSIKCKTSDDVVCYITNSYKENVSSSFQPKLDKLGMMGESYTSLNKFETTLRDKTLENFKTEESDNYAKACATIVDAVAEYGRKNIGTNTDFSKDIEINFSDEATEKLIGEYGLTDGDKRQISQWYGEALVPLVVAYCCFDNESSDTKVEFPSNNAALVDCFVNGLAISVKSALVKPHSPALSTIDATLNTIRDRKNKPGNATVDSPETHERIDVSFDPDTQPLECELVDEIFPRFNPKNTTKGASQEAGAILIWNFLMEKHGGEFPRCKKLYELITTGGKYTEINQTLKKNNVKDKNNKILSFEPIAFNESSITSMSSNDNLESQFVRNLDALFQYDLLKSSEMRNGEKYLKNVNQSWLCKYVHEFWDIASTNFSKFTPTKPEYQIENYHENLSNTHKYSIIMVALRRIMATMLNKLYVDGEKNKDGLSPMSNVVNRLFNVIQAYIGVKFNKKFNGVTFEFERLNDSNANFRFVGSTTNLGNDSWKYIMGFELTKSPNYNNVKPKEE